MALGTVCARLAIAQENPTGEVGAALAAAFSDQRPSFGGEARAGIYFLDRNATPMLLGNRLGFDVRFRALYGENSSGAASGNFLLGVAPSFTYEFTKLYRRSRGIRVPSVVGLVLPEPGLWIRSAEPPRFHLGWRAPLYVLPGGEGGFEVAPSFVWAPAGAWLAMVSFGGFVR
jgi:hypothetical protein